MRVARTTNFLMTLLDTNGHFVFRNEIEQGRLFRWPYFESNNIPSNLGSGTDESLIILADMAEVVVGDVASVEIARSDSATINGINLFERDQQAIRLRQWNDVVLRHDVGIAVMEAVKWGA